MLMTLYNNIFFLAISLKRIVGIFRDHPIISTVITTIFFITILLIGIVIFFENREPSKTAAWLLILILLPIVGFFYIYLDKTSERKGFLRKGYYR